MSKPTPKKSAFREWLDSIVFAVVAATLIRWLFLEAYTIPSSSMEKSLLIGDFLFVSKLHYGARTPGTPLQVPLTHQTIWGTNIPSFSTLIQLPMYRLPGFSDVKRNDVVVFNYPGDPDEPFEDPAQGNGGYKAFPVDLRTNFIKRCIGVGGDLIDIKGADVYVNGKPAEVPAKAQFYYRMWSTDLLDDRFFENEDIQDYSAYPGDSLAPNKFLYQIRTTPQIVEGLRKHSFIKDVKHEYRYAPGSTEMGLFPAAAKQNPDFWGPIQVPKKGLTIQLDSANVAKYAHVIKFFDHNDAAKVVVDKNTISIDGKAITSYTFNQDYYFMMGDNRYESADSRFWGFVPADHIVGKAVFIWMSIDPNPKSVLNKIRWNRLFRLID
ncbi:signal peptidase I [Runella sp.]|uniref:signal peptidase I n=1 Tax=Runella sp. TaxID=1960881 RepID=UPI003D12F1BF